jgi:adenylate kinase
MVSKKFLITGVHGVGKTTISRNKILHTERFHSRHWGDVMLDIALQQDLVPRGTKDLKKIGSALRETLQKEVALHLKKEPGNIIIDGHLIIPTSRGFIPGLQRELIEELGLDAMFILTSSPEAILERRNKEPDLYKDRLTNWDDIQNIEIHQNLLLSAAQNCSFHFNIPINVVLNEKDKEVETVTQIWKVLDKICNEK